MTIPSTFSNRLATNLLILSLLALLVYVAKSVLIPLGFAVMLAMLILPFVKWMGAKGIPDTLAIIIALLTAILFVAGIFYFLSAQIAGFLEDLPAIKEKLQQHWVNLQKWINETFNISANKQDQAIASAKESVQNSGSGNIGAVVSGFAEGLITMILLPIYTFLILFYRKLIHQFFVDVFSKGQEKKVVEVLSESNTIVRAYMLGLLLDMVIVTVLNAVGFFIIGIQYAIFLAVLAAVLNLIPYIGMLIASVICMAITLTTSDNSADILWTGAILIIVQFIENNFIMPYIVGSKVRINALISIVGVFAGGLLAGISGMFLSIPVIAIMKAVFDRVDDLKPWGLLLGDKSAVEKKPGRTRKNNQS